VSSVLYGLTGRQNCFMPGDTESGDTIFETEEKSEGTQTCSYQGCDAKGETRIDGDTPVCYDHAGEMAEQLADASGGSQPVFNSGSDDEEAAWLADDLDQNGNAYLSLKLGDGEYVNLFPNSDLLQRTLNEAHELRKN